MQQKIWTYKNQSLSRDNVLALSQRLSLSPVVTTLLLNRGLKTEEAIRAYLSKSMGGIHNPMLLPDMEAAADRILSAVDAQEKIVIYGDYDVDGITSTALLYQFLIQQNANVSYYIPDRAGEGYGINIMAVNKLAKGGTKLLITVDCGITAVGEVEFAKLQGLDVIITDHHTCKEKLPKALAVVNPKRTDCDYPFDALAGVGVAFKLVLALSMKLGLKTTDTFREYAELAAIGTIADVVPLLDENRIIADRGLTALAQTERPGLKALLQVAGADKRPPAAATVAFALAPRLNAAGRLSTAQTSVELLLTKDPQKAMEIAAGLDGENKARQMTEQEIFDEAMAMIDTDPNFPKKKVIVLAKEGWHHGVIGIVASRICERFYRPCILISHENGVGKGSGRSIASFNLFDALTHCAELLTNFGGHAVAAGLGINSSDLEAFTAKINKYADGVLKEDDMVPHLSIDCEISPSMVTIENIKYLSRLEPFGMGNETPVFSMHRLELVSAGQMGVDNKHLRLRLKKNGCFFSAVGFHMGEYFSILQAGDYVDAAFQMDINHYNGMEQVQLKLKDLRKSSAPQQESI